PPRASLRPARGTGRDGGAPAPLGPARAARARKSGRLSVRLSGIGTGAQEPAAEALSTAWKELLRFRCNRASGGYIGLHQRVYLSSAAIQDLTGSGEPARPSKTIWPVR